MNSITVGSSTRGQIYIDDEIDIDILGVPSKWVFRGTDGYIRVIEGNEEYVGFRSWDSTIVASSDDAIIWTVQSTSLPPHSLYIGYGDGIYIALNPTSTVLYTSPDLITWTPRTITGSGNYDVWHHVIYDGSRFIAVGRHSVWNTTITAISSDGITWPSVNRGTTGTLLRVVYNADDALYVAVGRSISTNLASFTSSDAVTWTLGNFPNHSGTAYDLVFAEGKYIAAVSSVRYTNSIPIYYSEDGINWIEATFPDFTVPSWKTPFARSVAYGGGKFAASIGKINEFDELVSKDGISWAPAGGAGGGAYQEWVIHTGRQFVSQTQGNIRTLKT